MIYVVYALVAVLGTAVHLWRHPADRAAGRAVEVALIWWIVVTIGIAGIVGAGFHLFDGPAIAEEIGNTGPVLYTDILFPLVAVALYAVRERLRGGGPVVDPTASPSQVQP